MSSDIDIRQACVADEEALTGLYLAMMRELAPYGYDLQPNWFNAAVLVRSFLTGFVPVMIAVHGRRIIGFLCWCAPTKDSPLKPVSPTAIGHGRYVLPEYRRMGVADRLVKAALPILKSHGVTRVVISVLEPNEAGRKHLEGLGAKVLGRQYELKI